MPITHKSPGRACQIVWLHVEADNEEGTNQGQLLYAPVRNVDYMLCRFSHSVPPPPRGGRRLRWRQYFPETPLNLAQTWKRRLYQTMPMDVPAVFKAVL